MLNNLPLHLFSSIRMKLNLRPPILPLDRDNAGSDQRTDNDHDEDASSTAFEGELNTRWHAAQHVPRRDSGHRTTPPPSASHASTLLVDRKCGEILPKPGNRDKVNRLLERAQEVNFRGSKSWHHRISRRKSGETHCLPGP